MLVTALHRANAMQRTHSSNERTNDFFELTIQRGNRASRRFNGCSGIRRDFVRQWDSLTTQGRHDHALQIRFRFQPAKLCALDK